MARLIRSVALGLALALPLAASGQPAPPDADFQARGQVEPFPAPLASAVDSITAGALAAHIAFLASPTLEGRGLGDRSLDAALEYAAASLALAGVAPPESGRFQVVPLRELGAITGQVTVTRRNDEQSSSRVFAAGVDCLLPTLPSQSLTAGVVFAGLGIREPALGRDDTAGLDARGKVLLVVAGLPAGAQWQTKELKDRYDAKDPDDRYTARVELARELGAVAVLAVEPEGWTEHVKQATAEDSRAFLPLEDVPAEGPPLVRVSPAVARALLGGTGKPLADEPPRALPHVTVTVEVRASERVLQSRNVLGVIPGSDSALAGEVVLLGTHADHLGRKGDVIYPGADDNASGVAALLEIARAFATAERRPKRTVAFAVWTGEEEGKLGSGHYVRHPLWPLASTTYLNLDMVGYPWLAEDVRAVVTGSGIPNPDAFLATFETADYVEPGLPRGLPELDAALRRAARGTGLALHLDRTDGKHGGSDYRDFARAGVPFVRFCDNYSPYYHSGGDTAERLDPRQALKLTRLAAATAWLLADR